MGILHLRINKANQNIDLPKEFRAQKLIFLRSIIVKDVAAGATYGGTIMVDLDFFNGFEMTSNTNDNFLIIPIKKAEEVQTQIFDQEFNSEDIKQSFNVKVYTSDGKTAAGFAGDGGSDAGKITYLDLFFQVQSLYDYTQY
jgi:hypothetical protein